MYPNFVVWELGCGIPYPSLAAGSIAAMDEYQEDWAIQKVQVFRV